MVNNATINTIRNYVEELFANKKNVNRDIQKVVNMQEIASFTLRKCVFIDMISQTKKTPLKLKAWLMRYAYLKNKLRS